MRGRIDLRTRIDIDVSVATVRIKIRQREDVMLHRRAAEGLSGLDGQLAQQILARDFEVTGDFDDTNFVNLAFVDIEGNGQAVAVTLNDGFGHMHVEETVVVVEGA